MVKLDASEAKNNAAPTISGGLPGAFQGEVAEGSVAVVEVPRLADVGQSTARPSSVLTRTVGPNAWASPSVMALSPALAAA